MLNVGDGVFSLESSDSSSEGEDKPKDHGDRYIDRYTGAHFKYLDLYEKVYELKCYRKHVDKLLGIDNSTSDLECIVPGSECIVPEFSSKHMRRNEVVFKLQNSRKKNQSVFSQIGEQIDNRSRESSMDRLL